MIIKQFLRIAMRLLPIKISNYIELKVGRVAYGNGIKLIGRLIIKNKGDIRIGNCFRCNSGVYSNTVGGPYQSALIVLRDAKLSIGNNVGISGTVICCRDSITIEDNVLIGSGTCIYDNDFHSIDYGERINGVEGIASRPVCIGEGAFIGARCIILKGVTIGKRCVIGAGAVVTKSIPDGEVWAGNPARFIKKVE